MRRSIVRVVPRAAGCDRTSTCSTYVCKALLPFAIHQRDAHRTAAKYLPSDAMPTQLASIGLYVPHTNVENAT